MTVDIQHVMEWGFTTAYTLYRRGEKKSETTAGITRYAVIEVIKMFNPKQDPLGSLDLTLWDIFSAESLNEHGLIYPRDQGTSIVLSSKALSKCLDQAWNKDFSFSKEMERLTSIPACRTSPCAGTLHRYFHFKVT
jgi:hypothetical protein